MQYLVNAAQMKSADQYTIQKLGVPSLELMERAADGCIQIMEQEKMDFSDVCVVCGTGNNGGDGFAIARMLLEKDYKVQAFLVGDAEHCTKNRSGNWRHAAEKSDTVYRKTDITVW